MGPKMCPFGTLRHHFGTLRSSFGIHRYQFGAHRYPFGTLRYSFGNLRYPLGTRRYQYGTFWHLLDTVLGTLCRLGVLGAGRGYQMEARGARAPFKFEWHYKKHCDQRATGNTAESSTAKTNAAKRNTANSNTPNTKGALLTRYANVSAERARYSKLRF